MNQRKKTRGGSLVEVIVATLITGFLLVPVLNMLVYAATSYQKQSTRDRAALLAADLMAEIQSKEYQDETQVTTLGSDAGELGRQDFDDVDDFHNLDELPPKHTDGSLVAGANGFRRKTLITYLSQSTSDRSVLSRTSTPTRLKLISVKVYFGDKLIRSLDSIVTQDGLRSDHWSGGKKVKRISTSMQLGPTDLGTTSSVSAFNLIPEELPQ